MTQDNRYESGFSRKVESSSIDLRLVATPPVGILTMQVPQSCLPLQLVQRVRDWYTLKPLSTSSVRTLTPGAARSCLIVSVSPPLF